MILHITTRQSWEEAQKAGEYKAPSLNSEGFIHCSTSKQTVDTANLYFKGQKGLVLLCIDENKLIAECRFEPPAGGKQHDQETGNLFPHIYGPINLSSVIRVVDFPTDENGLFKLPPVL
jgi:uncharacterized protein (DUF952 family)